MRRGSAIVTGSSSGFGLRIAVTLATRGFRVYATMRDPSRADALRRALAEAHADAEILRLDVTDPDSIEAAVAHVEHACDAVDVLVNNAGTMLTGFVEDLADDEVMGQLDVNVLGALRVTRACLPAMRERRHGRIITVSSIGGRSASPGHGAYNASKFAVEGLMEALRAELAPWGVHVSLVEPGLFPTELFGRNHWRARRSEDPASPYAGMSRRLDAFGEEVRHHMAGADPGAVARVVGRVATARRPRLRYPVGVDAWYGALLRPAMPGLWAQRMRELGGVS